MGDHLFHIPRILQATAKANALFNRPVYQRLLIRIFKNRVERFVYYILRDFAPGKARHGYVVAQGSSATFNLVSVLPRLEQAGINVKVIAAICEELFDHQPEAYRNAVLPPEARQDLMFVMSGTRRMWPLRNVGSLTDAYSLTADQDNVWLTGGTEADVIAEARLDAESIFAGVERFAHDRAKRIAQQRALLDALR